MDDFWSERLAGAFDLLAGFIADTEVALDRLNRRVLDLEARLEHAVLEYEQ